MRKLTVSIILSATLTLAVITMMSIPVSADSGNQVIVCCTWGEELADGKLTYKVSGGDAEIQSAMIAAIEDWDDKLVGLELEANTLKGKDSKADIIVKFKKGGGPIAGQASRDFEKNTAYVQSVKIKVSGKAFGNENTVERIYQITKHEVGHALGINHVNFSGDLMSTSAGASDISDCDVQGVLEANHWALVDNPAGGKHTPHVTHVHCP